MRVLLVDDEQKFALMLAKRLEIRGIRVAVFFSGDKALEAVEQENRFDVAILDVKMPGIGGVELKRRLAARDPQMKFVFLTGHGSHRENTPGIHDAEDCLPKPLKIEALIAILNRLSEGPPGTAGDRP